MNKVLLLNNFVPDEICKKMCELFDESDELKGERQFFRGENLHAIVLNCKTMMSTRHGKDWKVLTNKFGKGINLAYKKWCEKFDHKQQETHLEIPVVHRYDPGYGIHKSSQYKKVREVGCFFYLTDKAGKIKIGDETIQPKKGMCLVFPPDEDHKFEELPDKTHMKYVVKGYNYRK